ncbi:hypothetical protein DICSQDRAFT_128739 [Dichomitus squalens LYAD-421 SS1]|uniref:F-box domain-containing protein n=1 Tax=Dichomitus squalens (strain LYAD-421) TaxID=732165 RepID=R7SS31_DICSQ|nr:uncharacterized protein DICSQDRAFT_128739 [Dichomitus squalens LYAD-421 SS1]EJF58743.1 hypothetical protein DICSQDRAFT_128739 [Dichomitus squalens LYAD-421 SS1]
MNEQEQFEGEAVDANNAIAELLRDYKRWKSAKTMTVHNCPSPFTSLDLLPLPTCRPSQPCCGIFAIPTELKQTACSQIDSARDMASLSRTCRFMAEFLEDFRYHEVAVRSPAGLASLCRGLSSVKVDRLGRTRAERLRVLTISWMTTASLPRTRSDLNWVLSRVPNVRHLSVDIPVSDLEGNAAISVPVTRQIPLDHLQSLSSLTTTATLVRRLRSPVPSLTCLAVDMVYPLDAAVLTEISRTFGQTLEKLRLVRAFHNRHSYSWQSPARVCDALLAPRLEHLELWDRATMEDTGLDSTDLVADNSPLHMHASAGVPALRTLMWAPAWRGASSTDTKRFKIVMRTYRAHLLAILEPIALAICVSDTHAYLAWSKEDRTRHKAPSLVEVTSEMWEKCL